MTAADLKKFKTKAESIVDFPQGLIGFSTAKRFVLIEDPSSDRFLWLRSVDRPELAFLVISIPEILPDYVIDMDRSDLEFLALTDATKAERYGIVTIPDHAMDATVNLRSPVVINPKARLGKQIVLEQGRYSIHHALLKEQASVKAGAAV